MVQITKLKKSIKKNIEQVKEETKNTFLQFESKIKFFITVFFVLFLFFSVGTFLPNPYTKYKLTSSIEKQVRDWANNIGLLEPSFEYSTRKEFVERLTKCIDWINFETPRYERVPYDMIIGMAVLESNYGQSRFAKEANNLFGIRTYDKNTPNILIAGATKWPGWGLRVFSTKCQSVVFYVKLLNNHSAYKEFRLERKKQLLFDETLNSDRLLDTMKNFSTTEDYADRVRSKIKQFKELK